MISSENMPCSSSSSSTSSSSSEDDSDDEEYLEKVPVKKRRKILNYDNNKNVKIIEEEDYGENGKRKKVYRCHVCEKRFRYPGKLHEHHRIHKESRYRCPICTDLNFDTHHALRAHSKEMHSQASHKCQLCSYTNQKPAFVKRHFLQNHVHGIPCTIQGCSLKFAKNRLRNHIREAHSLTSSALPPMPSRAEISYEKCLKCGYQSDSTDLEAQREDVMRHMEIIHEKKDGIPCSLGCGAIISLAELWSHLLSCQREPESSEIPKSEDCTNTMTTWTEPSQDSSECVGDLDLEDDELLEPLTKKKTWAHSRGEFQCEICGNVLSRRETLRKHVLTNHSNAPPKPRKRRQFKCERLKDTESSSEKCGKTFRTEQALSDHYNVHDDKKPYACGSCKQRFHARDRFAVHLQKYHQMSIKSLSSCEAELGFGIWSKSAVLTSSSDGPGRILHLPECSEILSAPSTSSEPPEELVTSSVIT